MWDYLKTTKKPIVLYGMGNAAKHILDELRIRNIPVAGIFASDGFVRGHSFEGFPVSSYSDAKERFGDMVVLLCFGSHLDDVLLNIQRISKEQELYAPDLPVVGEGLFTSAYAKEHEEDLNWLRSVLADDTSREVLDKLIEYRITGKIEYLFDIVSSDEENYKLLNLNDNESYLDLGAYTGDTIKEFLELTGGYKSIVAVEPEERNFRKLKENTAALENITLINAAISSHDGTLMFTHGIGRGGSIGKGKTREIPCVFVDGILSSSNFEVSYIKMDLEGEEIEALKGAEKTIATKKPKLLLAAYHRIDDYWEIPKLILRYNPDYKIYLRKSKGLPAFEVNYYCV